MADKFEYLSPRRFKRLSTAEKDRYLMALYDHLHGMQRQDQDAPQGQGDAKTQPAVSPRGESP